MQRCLKSLYIFYKIKQKSRFQKPLNECCFVYVWAFSLFFFYWQKDVLMIWWQSFLLFNLKSFPEIFHLIYTGLIPTKHYTSHLVWSIVTDHCQAVSFQREIWFLKHTEYSFTTCQEPGQFKAKLIELWLLLLLETVCHFKLCLNAPLLSH